MEVEKSILGEANCLLDICGKIEAKGFNLGPVYQSLLVKLMQEKISASWKDEFLEIIKA
jgi:hypothetical protein